MASPRSAEDLGDGLSSDGPKEEEVKVGCTLAMLQCLDRPHRLAYVLGEILELPGPDAAQAIDIDADTFRNRLQRAREETAAFTREYCGLVSDDAACRCNRRVPAALRLGRVRSDTSMFAEAPTSFEEARSMVRRVEEARRSLEVHRASTARGSDVDFARRVVLAMGTSAVD